MMGVPSGLVLLLSLQIFTESASGTRVQFNCGHVVCPFGTDCIGDNGNLCADPCENYTVLNDDWRSVNNTSQEILHCDQYINWQGWYRLFLGNNSARIPEWCVDANRCGTHATLWITEPHPAQVGEIEKRTVCNSWSGSCCQFRSHIIHVKLCYGNFYVYKLARPSNCHLAYCADVNPTNPPVPPTTPGSTLPTEPSTTNRGDITITTTASNSTGVEGQIRLANGNSSCSGRVEIFHSGQWGTVCDDSWSLLDAQVACRQMGCGRAISTQYFGPGTGPIWLAEVMCTGKEPRLTECSHQGNGSHNCNHQEDAGVVCEAGSPVRLVNSDNRCSGRVEVYHDGQWGTVCDDNWDLNDAQVVCRQVECGIPLSAPRNAAYGAGRGPIWLDDVNCYGSELSITDCRHRGLEVSNCQHIEDASVVCENVNPTNPPVPLTTPGTTPQPQPSTTSQVDITTTTTTADNSTGVEGQIRLANGGNSSCSGRVEIFHHGRWGTVCNDSWSLLDAQVVCRQLGCGRAISTQYFGPGTGPIWLDEVMCSGSESKLTECSHQGNGSHNCNHGEDAGVVCEVQQPPLQPPQLICGRDKLQIGLNLVGVASSGFDPFSGNLAARNCSQFRVHGNVVWYEVEAREGVCGNTLRTNSTHAIYSNSLFIYPGNESFGLPASLPFSCAYPLDTDASLNVAISPFLSLEDGTSGLGSKAKASMTLFRSSNYTDMYPSGQIVLPVGSPLYVGVSVEEVDSLFVVILEDCYATHSSNPDDPMRYFLIQNKCPTDRRQVSVTESGSSLHARFTALLFLLQDEYQDTFLHCSLSLCDQRKSSCVPPCTSRRSRSVSTSEPLKPLTIGPIIWVK